MEFNNVTENCPPLDGAGGGNAEAKLQEWEHNHTLITGAIAKFVEDYARMPTKTELAADTGLSRQTIAAHMEEMATHPSYRQEIEFVRILSTKVLGKVSQMAMKGDLDASRLFSKLMSKGFAKPANEMSPQFYLHLQVNGADLTQGKLLRLSPEHRATIESALRAPEGAEWHAGNEIWEKNHEEIVQHIDDFMKKNSQVPTAMELAAKSGLSRQTITKHLNEFVSHPMYREEIESFRCLSRKVLARVAIQAEEGNKKALKIFFEILHNLYPHAVSFPERQHQLFANNYPFNQEKINRLSPEQKSIIHNIIKDLQN